VITLRQLEAGDDLSTFSSGNEHLDSWLRRNGLGNQHRYGVTYLALDDGAIAGFVTVSASSIARARIGGGGPDTWPVLLLGRMAVAQDRQGQKIGQQLLRHVFSLAAQQHLTIGCAAVVVDSKPESVGFYKKYGFKPTRVPADASPAAQTQMYIAMKTVFAAMEQSS
jgi:predicted N-acetyltransferase YhbS